MDDQLKEHLKSVESAGARTRTAVGVLLVACVLGFVAFMNSWEYGWIAQRADKVGQDDQYAARKLGFISDFGSAIPKSSDPADLNRLRNVARAMSKALIQEYAENGFKDTFPFSGAIVDVYDLSLVAGLGYATILLLLFYSLNTETTALRLAFSCGAKTDAATLKNCYAIIATRQVLSIPKTLAVTDRTRRRPPSSR